MGELVDQMLSQIRKAKEQGADLVEVRLDFLKNFSPKQDLEILLKQNPMPTPVTYRPKREGGQYEGDDNRRLDTLRVALESGADYVDVGLQVAHEFSSSIHGKKPEKVKIIVSSH